MTTGVDSRMASGQPMSSCVGPLRQVETTKGHYYVDAHRRRIPGVTSITGALPKDALISWAANATAAYAIDHWDELGGLSPSERLRKLQSARYEDRDKAANRGTEVHRLGQRLVTGDCGSVLSLATEVSESTPSTRLALATYDICGKLVARVPWGGARQQRAPAVLGAPAGAGHRTGRGVDAG